MGWCVARRAIQTNKLYCLNLKDKHTSIQRWIEQIPRNLEEIRKLNGGNESYEEGSSKEKKKNCHLKGQLQAT